MKFLKHPDPTMGIFVAEIEIRGEMVEAEHLFNLAENPEWAEQYRQWLATQPEENN